MSYYLNHTVPFLKYSHFTYPRMTVSDKRWKNDWFYLTATAQRVKNALQNGADARHRYRDGWTLLERACIFSEDPAVIQALIDAGADPNSRAEAGWTPLLLAARCSNSAAVIRTLLENGAGLQAVTREGSRALHWAMTPRVPDINSSHCALIETLIQAGAALEERNKNDWAPLHAAAAFAGSDVVKALLDVGANPSVLTNDGFTPLHAVSEFCGNSISAELLLDAGTDPNAGATSYLTNHAQSLSQKRTTFLGEILDMVVFGPFRSWTPVISAAGSYDNRLALHDGWTPLHSAAKFSEDSRVIEVLLEGGADPDAKLRLSEQGSIGNIRWLVTHERSAPAAWLKFLMRKRAIGIKKLGVFAEVLDGGTPLHVAAAFNSNPKAIEALLTGGAGKTAKTSNGISALQVAEKHNSNWLVKEALL